MTLCELLNQELSVELKRSSSLTWALYYLIDRATGGTWVSKKELKHLLEDITNSTRTEIAYAQPAYKKIEPIRTGEV